jgi:ABC-2 type transport system permease protein
VTLAHGFWRRVWAMTVKEVAQMRRDRVTFAMMLAIPVIQLLMFGYAINTDPKHLPTAVYARDNGPLSRAVIASLSNSGYFEISRVARTAGEVDRLLASGSVQFGVEIPANFERDVRRGQQPQLLVTADATDPSASGNAVAALQGIATTALARELRGPDGGIQARPAPFEIVVHRRYNPTGITQLNIVPGLLGIVLTMTMMMFTALAVTREFERGTMESLLAMPIRPSEVMLGKILPFVVVGFFQAVLILVAAHYLFGVPVEGSLILLSVLTTLFVLANLAVGYTFSTVAENQLQAVQMTFMFFLPNILLSGFMFPFRGMPQWAQWIGELLPLTHFLRIVRGIMLKGNGAADMWVDIGGIVAFVAVAAAIALARFRQTLD